jgi:hypothetical protein
MTIPQTADARTFPATNDYRRVVQLCHELTLRTVPVEVPTVVGRNDVYYRYTDVDERPDRLAVEVADRLAALNYIKVCSDTHVSRTHGLVDPRGPTVRDLNSTNGTFLNGKRLIAVAGTPGPEAALADRDLVELGGQRFRVNVRSVSTAEVTAGTRARRHALVATDRARLERARTLSKFLGERKGFSVRPAAGLQALVASTYRLQAEADPEGLALIALCCEVEKDELVLDDQRMAFDRLLPLLARIPGRKVVALDAVGDPSTVEQVFVLQAYEDMMLMTGHGGSPLDAPLVGTIGTSAIESIKRSVGGDSSGLRGAYDELEDGVDALVGADTNILKVDWLPSYRGRLKVVFGGRPRREDEALSHTLHTGSTTFRF